MITKIGLLTATLIGLAFTAAKAQDGSDAAFSRQLGEGRDVALIAVRGSRLAAADGRLRAFPKDSSLAASTLRVTSAYINVKYTCAYDISDPRSSEKGIVRAYWETLVLQARDRAAVTLGKPDFGSYQKEDPFVFLQGNKIGTLIDNGAPRDFAESCKKSVGISAINGVPDAVSRQMVSLDGVFEFRPAVVDERFRPGGCTADCVLDASGPLIVEIATLPFRFIVHALKFSFSEEYRHGMGYP